MKKEVLHLFEHLYSNDFAQLRREWSQWLHGNQLKKIFTPNPEQIVLAQENKEYCQTLSQADVLLPDGIGVVGAEALLLSRSRLLHRMPGTEVVEWWLREGSEGKIKTLLIGGQGDTAKKVADRFDLTGEWCSAVAGYEDISAPTAAEEKSVETLIKTWQPKVVFVAFGAPAQERWVLDHAALLERCGVRVAMVCGGAFDFLSGNVERAPQWVRALGMEWAFRLIQEPWRWKRQLKLITFIQLIVQEIFLRGSQFAKR